jgi:membrane protease YdiL (CAAX protease family)
VKKIKLFASDHPLTFGLIVSMLFILMLVFSAMLGALWPGEVTYGQPGGILGRVVSIAILITVLSRLGWLRTAGFTTPGLGKTWLILLLPLAYSIIVSAYAMTGNFFISTSGPELTGLVAMFILTAAFMEEVAFRGLILHAFVRAWGSTHHGLIKSTVVSSLFFCCIHLLDILSGRPLLNVFLQSLQALFLGVYLGSLVLRGKSIYPAVFFHASFNLAGFFIFGSTGLEPTAVSWLLLSLLMLPLALHGIYLLWGVLHRSVLSAAA